jgi:Protein kinase domain
MGPLLGRRYQVVHPVWHDRLGETYVARDRRTGFPVAVRVLRGDLAGCAVALRCRAELERLTALRHPRLARVLDLTDDRGVLGIVSEVVEGQTLRQHLRTRRLPAGEVARIGAGVAAGLTALHEAGLLHQHLGTHNVVLTPAGEVVLTDVAVGHLVSAGPAGRELLRAPAPEVVEGAAPTPAADLFALGALLHDLGSRRRSVPLRGLVRRLRARDPRARPTARQARMRLCGREGRHDDDAPAHHDGIAAAGVSRFSVSASATVVGQVDPDPPLWSGCAP